jgi:hypothetical protein
MPEAKPRQTADREAAIVTRAAVAAAGRLGLSNRVLANILGLSEATVSRMTRGDYVLQGKSPFELGVLFVRLYRSLDAIVGGDDAVAGQWLRNANTVLNARPIDRIQSIAGLTDVIQYLDARRAVG